MCVGGWHTSLILTYLKAALTWWFSSTDLSLYSKARSVPTLTWKLFVRPVCSKSWIMAANRREKISRSVNMFCWNTHKENKSLYYTNALVHIYLKIKWIYIFSCDYSGLLLSLIHLIFVDYKIYAYRSVFTNRQPCRPNKIVQCLSDVRRMNVIMIRVL